MNDVAVDERPKFLTEHPTESTHAIRITGSGDEVALPPLTIHLAIRGVISCFDTRKPTAEEYETLPRYELTYENPVFDPYDPSFASQEAACVDFRGHIVAPGDRNQTRRLFGVATTASLSNTDSELSGISPTDSELSGISPTLVAETFHQCMVATVRVSSIGSKHSGPGITAEKLAKNWGISLERAEKTIKATTQRGVRTVLHPSLSRRFRTNDRQLRYRRLPITCFTDTMKSNIISKRGNKYAQVYCSAEGWTRVFPIKKRSEAHETVSLLFARDGVPNVMVMDGAREQVMGEFKKKCRQAGTHIRQTEPHTPFSNAAESAIRELKKGVGRQMVRSKAPKVLWDHCVERQAYVRSNTAHNNYQLFDQVPETVVSGETSDITTFAEFQWYEWIKFRDTAVSFPEDTVLLGRDLGPAIDIGPAYTRKILKDNGQVVYRSTVRSLTP
ncbi:MAG: hypothetical protein ACRCT2_08740, partial [Plesiomonas shigelloides]